MADVSNEASLPSVDSMKPLEEGGPIARSGFKYQDEIAVGFLVEMLESPSILKIHCETHDDVVLVRAVDDSTKRLAEFVQVKAGEPDKLWSAADLCARKSGKVGSSIFETSLARDKYAEDSQFRIVTLRPVVEQLKLLTYPLSAEGRSIGGPRFRSLEAELNYRLPEQKSPKGNGTGYWIANCYWDQRHSEESVRKDNLVRLWRLSADEGQMLLPYAAEIILEELRGRAKAAGDARWEPDREHKIITREALRQWWDQRLCELAEDVTATGQPPLALDQFPINETTRLHFAARGVPFVGRDAEMAELLGWMANNRRFSWWIITGAGGVGKSRLALECSLNLPTWRAGFLPHNHGIQSWHDWQPNRPTLMLIDYAASRPNQVRDIVQALASRKTPLKHPVRVLLLERQSEGPWWNTFFRAGTTSLWIKQTLFANPMALQSISRDAAWETIVYILNQYGSPLPIDRESVVQSLETLDPERRPLFVALAAYSLAAGRDIRQWSKLQLLDDILHRETMYFWEPAGVTESDRNILALATMVGGLPLAALKDLANETGDGFFPAAKNYLPERYATMCGQSATQRLHPLEPDIIGEFFALEHVKPRHALDLERAERLRQLAWRHRPDGAFSFLRRAALDFPDHPSLGVLTQPASEDFFQRSAWSFLAANLVAIYSSNGDTGAARSVYDQLAALTEEHATEKPLVEALATGAFNLATAYGLRGDLSRALEMHGSLNDLSLVYLGVPEVRVAWAQSAANLIDDFAKGGYLEQGEDLYDQLAMIASTLTAEPILRESWAKGAVNLSVAYGEAGRADAVGHLYNVVADLKSQYPDEPSLRDSAVRAANNAILFLGKAKKFDDARAVLRDLALIVDSNPMEPDLRTQMTNIGATFVTLAARAGDLELAIEVRNELRIIAENHADEPALRLPIAECAIPLIARYGDQRAFADAVSLCHEVAAMARLPEPQPGLRLAHASAITALLVAQAAAKNFDDAQNTYRDLIELAATSTNSAMREELARATFSLVSHLSGAQHWPLAKTVYRDLERLAKNFVSEPALREQLAKAAFNLFDRFREASNLESAREIYEDLSELERNHPEEVELRRQLTKAAVNLCASYATQQPDLADPIYHQLEALAQKNPDDDEVSGCRDVCGLNLVQLYLYRNDVIRARSVAISAAAYLRSPQLRAAVAASWGRESMLQLFAVIDELLK